MNENLLKFFIFQLNIIYLSIIYYQNTQMNVLKDNLDQLQKNILSLENDIKTLKLEKIDMIQNSSEIIEKVDISHLGKIIGIISSILVLIRFINNMKNFLTVFSSFSPFVLKISSYFMHINEEIIFSTDTHFYKIILKDRQILDMAIKDHIEKDYQDLDHYILNLISSISELEEKQIVNSDETKEAINMFLEGISNL